MTLLPLYTTLLTLENAFKIKNIYSQGYNLKNNGFPDPALYEKLKRPNLFFKIIYMLCRFGALPAQENKRCP